MITMQSQKNSINAQSHPCALDLRCEYLRNPLGIDVREPRLAWRMESAESGQKQTAYRLIVASKMELLSSGAPDLWDSGKIASDQSAHVPYAGKPLAGGQCCYWQVQLWDKDGRPTEFSEPAWWEMGLLEPGDWKASWITRPGSNDGKSSPLFRREFQAGKPVNRARLYICGIGLYEASVNGELVSAPLARQKSVLPERVFYDTYDVTDLVKKGGNAMGVWLGAGWFGQENGFLDRMDKKVVLSIAREHKYMLIAQLAIQYADDTTEWVVSDDNWRTAPSGLEPVSYLGFYYHFSGELSDGETRRAHLGWNTASFDDRAWPPARKIKSPTQRLAANMIEPNRIVETLTPVSNQPISAHAAWLEEYLPAIWEKDLGTSARVVFERPDCRFAKLPSAPFLGGVEYDFGKKVSGWARLKVTGSKGDYVSILGLDTYCLTGEPDEELCLRSAHRVFHHLPVLFFGQGQAPVIREIQALAIQNDLRPVGRFACSDPTLTRIHDVSARTYSAMILRGVPMEGIREHVGTAFFQNYEQSFYGLDMGAFYTKWLTDYRDLQGPDGNSISSGAPLHYPVVAWVGSLFSLSRLSWLMYLYYGDPDILETNYPAMKRFLEFCFRQEGKFSWQPQGGDDESYAGQWNRPGDEGIPDLKKDGRQYHDAAVGDLMDTLLLIDTLNMSLSVASVLNKPEDAEQFTQWRDRLVKKVNRPGNLDAHRGIYGAQPGYINGDMGCQATALALDIVPEEIRGKAAAWLIHDIMVNRKGHLGTGMIGSYYLLRSLIALNRPDVAYTAIGHPTPPSWVSAVRLGDSMLAEFWDDYPKQSSGLAEPHLCCVGFWFYQSLGGIRPDPAAPGFKRVMIHPQIVRALTWVKAEYDSIRGTIRSDWTLAGERLKMSVTIPANVAAVIYVPTADKQSVIAPKNDAVRFVRMEEDTAVFETGSGTHVFESTLPPIRIPALTTITPDILSPYKRHWRVSDPLENAVLCMDKPITLNWKSATAEANSQGAFLNFLALHGKRGGVVYAEGEIEAPVAMKTLLLLGPDGPCKVWLDGALVGETYRSIGGCEPDTAQFPVALTKGRHTITVLFDRRGGRAWGFRLRFKRLVADETEQELPVMDLG